MTTGCLEQTVECPQQLRPAYKVQRDLAAASTLQSELVWDVLGPDQACILEKKLECLYPEDKTVYTDKQNVRKSKKFNSQQKALRSKLFQNIWEQRKYTNAILLHSIIYILVTDELDVEKAKYSQNYTLHPIFRTRRCLNSNSSSGCCMIFIDDQSRIYQNWNDFVNNNKLPIGTMVAPANGCYSLGNKDEVQLECRHTPAHLCRSLSAVDGVFSTLSVVAHAASHFQPLFSILAIGAKTYETIRDYQNMTDKERHGTASRATTYCSLGGNVLSLTSSIATLGVKLSVAEGKSLSYNSKMSIQVINGAATVVNCTKLIYTTYDIFTKYFNEGETLDFYDIIAFGSALIIWTHSINNMVIISQLTNDSGINLRNLLKTKIMNGLALIAGNAVRLGVANGDLLRLANDIPFKDVLLSIYSTYTNLTYSGFLSTVAALGTLILEVAPGITVQIVDKEIVEVDFAELKKHFGSKFVNHISNSTNLIDILNAMGQRLSRTAVQFVLELSSNFIDTVADMIDEQQNTFVSTEMILFKMFSYMAKNYKDFTCEYLKRKRDDLMQGVAQYFLSFNPQPTDPCEDAKRSCDICGGYFYLISLS